MAPVMAKNLNCRKDGELSIPGVASLGGAGYDFLRQSIANRLAWRTNGLGAHSGLRHGDGGPRAARAHRISGRRKSHPEDAALRPALPSSSQYVVVWPREQRSAKTAIMALAIDMALEGL